MSFFGSAMEVLGGGFETAEKFGQSALKEGEGFASTEGFGAVAGAAEVAGNVSDMVDHGINAKNTLGTLGGAAQVGLGLAQDNGEIEGLEDMDPTGVGSMVGGAATMFGGIGGMIQNSDQINQGYLSNDEGGRNEFWGSAGDATLGGVHAALGGAEAGLITADMLGLGTGGVSDLATVPLTAMAEGADKGLGLAELAVNGAGLASGLAGSAYNAVEGLSGEDAVNTYFTAGDVVGLGEHVAATPALMAAHAMLGSGSPASEVAAPYAD